MQKNIKKSVTTIQAIKSDLLLTKHRPDDSAVFQPHKSIKLTRTSCGM